MRQSAKTTNTREADLGRMAESIRKHLAYEDKSALVAEGDSLSLLQSLPDKSVTLILTDPPYHSTKKKNIYGDASFSEDKHFLEWMESHAKEWRRILRLNASAMVSPFGANYFRRACP